MWRITNFRTAALALTQKFGSQNEKVDVLTSNLKRKEVFVIFFIYTPLPTFFQILSFAHN